VANASCTGYQQDFGPDEAAYLMHEEPGAEHHIFNEDVMCKIGQLTKALEARGTVSVACRNPLAAMRGEDFVQLTLGQYL